MGIKGIREFLKKQCGETFEKLISFDELSGKIIVVDTSIFVCMYKIVYPDTFEEEFIKLFVSLLESGIDPVFVFDGNSPQEKAGEKKKRDDKKQAQNARVDMLERDLECYHKTQEISQALWDVNNKEFQTKLKKGGIILQNVFLVSLVTLYIKKLKSQILTVTNNDFILVKELLSLFGIPYIIAEGEAEILCSQLVKSNTAYAVLTKDTDVLACGCPIMLSNINLKARQFTVIYLEDILNNLNLDYSRWLDLCIMCGTDFNNNIPNIGPVKSFKYIHKHGNLEEISKFIDTSNLCYEKIRKIFTKNDEQYELSSKMKPDIEGIKTRIREHKLKLSLSKLSGITASAEGV